MAPRDVALALDSSPVLKATKAYGIHINITSDMVNWNSTLFSQQSELCCAASSLF
jgi:hypothetical protein